MEQLLRASDRPAPSYRAQPVRRNRSAARLVKDRTFFFVDYQGTRRTPARRWSPTCRLSPNAAATFRKAPWLRPIRPAGNRFPGNQVPQYILNPFGVALAALYPLPNRNLPAQTSYPRRSLTDGQTSSTCGWTTPSGHPTISFARYSFVDDNLFDPSPARRETPRYRVTHPGSEPCAKRGFGRDAYLHAGAAQRVAAGFPSSFERRPISRARAPASIGSSDCRSFRRIRATAGD